MRQHNFTNIITPTNQPTPRRFPGELPVDPTPEGVYARLGGSPRSPVSRGRSPRSPQRQLITQRWLGEHDGQLHPQQAQEQQQGQQQQEQQQKLQHGGPPDVGVSQGGGEGAGGEAGMRAQQEGEGERSTEAVARGGAEGQGGVPQQQ